MDDFRARIRGRFFVSINSTSEEVRSLTGRNLKISVKRFPLIQLPRKSEEVTAS